MSFERARAALTDSKGGGYYIDVGCSQLIIDGKVKIKQGQEISKLTKTGVLFADGTELPADIVVCATGYSSMRETVRRLISDDVADRLHTVWGEDQQGEIPSAWRNTGVPGFWLQPGNFLYVVAFLVRRLTVLQPSAMLQQAPCAPDPDDRAWPRQEGHPLPRVQGAIRCEILSEFGVVSSCRLERMEYISAPVTSWSSNLACRLPPLALAQNVDDPTQNF